MTPPPLMPRQISYMEGQLDEVRNIFIRLNFDAKTIVYDNEITALIDIYFLRISFIPSEPF
jgi:hypothetical protein